jgi:pimeloyl-ACP methyl ester carboxylesterase
MEKRICSKVLTGLFLAAITGPLWTHAGTAGAGDYKTTYVSITSGTPGVLYEPVTPGPKAYLGLFVMHNFSDALQHVAAIELSKRGYRVLAANSVYANNPGSDQDWDRMMFQVRDGVNYLLTKVPGITKVILIGHSSGAPMMATYQNIAENGAANACQGPEKIIKCPSTFTGFHPADGLILLDPVIGGMGANTLVSIDPALVSETNAQAVNPSLDMFDPKNGFSPNGATYPEEFKQRFLAAEARRMHELIDKALDRLANIQAGRGSYGDDEPFIVMGARPTDIKLWRPDLHLLFHTRNKYMLLTKNGATGPQTICSVRVP